MIGVMLLYKERLDFELFSIYPYFISNGTKETCCNLLGLFCSTANKTLHTLFHNSKVVSKGLDFAG